MHLLTKGIYEASIALINGQIEQLMGNEELYCSVGCRSTGTMTLSLLPGSACIHLLIKPLLPSSNYHNVSYDKDLATMIKQLQAVFTWCGSCWCRHNLIFYLYACSLVRLNYTGRGSHTISGGVKTNFPIPVRHPYRRAG